MSDGFENKFVPRPKEPLTIDLIKGVDYHEVRPDEGMPDQRSGEKIREPEQLQQKVLEHCQVILNEFSQLPGTSATLDGAEKNHTSFVESIDIARKNPFSPQIRTRFIAEASKAADSIEHTRNVFYVRLIESIGEETLAPIRLEIHQMIDTLLLSQRRIRSAEWYRQRLDSLQKS